MAIRVFLADDHAVVRDGVRLVLEANKDLCVVGTAGNGREAVRGVKELTPDVAIVDIAMPSISTTPSGQEPPGTSSRKRRPRKSRMPSRQWPPADAT